MDLQVFRRDSRKLPIGDPDVDWEETIYLNLIVHHLSYKITLAVYSRTSHKDIQVDKYPSSFFFKSLSQCCLVSAPGVTALFSESVRHPVASENGQQGRDGGNYLPTRLFYSRQF